MMYQQSYPDFDYNINIMNEEPALNQGQDQSQDRVLKISQETGYPIQQNNGQRKMGPPPDWTGPPPPKGCEVFVGSLPRNIYEDELYPLFSVVGKIYELRLMLDFSMSNRGYAFVMYTNPEDAAKAVNVLDNYEISNRKKIGVVMSKDNCRLFVGKIPKYVTREQILEEISNETEGVVNVIVKATVPSPDNPHPDTNFAFVEYETHHAAAMARRILLPTKIKLFGVDVTVDWAQPEEEANGDVMSRVTNLYVRSIQETVSESQLQELFSCKGQISVSKVKKIMDYAFVHFNCREAAETALRLISRDPTFGSQFSSDGFKLEVKWARPQEYSKRDKSRQNRGGYADNFNHRRDNDNGYNNQNYNRSYHSSNGYQGYSSRQYYRQEYNPHHQYERRSVTYTQNRNQSSGNYFAVPHFSGNQAGSENRQSVFNSVRNPPQDRVNYFAGPTPPATWTPPPAPHIPSLKSDSSKDLRQDVLHIPKLPDFAGGDVPLQQMYNQNNLKMFKMTPPLMAFPSPSVSPQMMPTVFPNLQHSVHGQSPLGSFGSLTQQVSYQSLQDSARKGQVF